MVFAVSAMVVLGFVGMATEAGTWYLGRRDAQNAADAAAVAGALAAYAGGDAAGSAGTAAERNGFASGGKVAVATVVTAPSGSEVNPAVAVTVSQQNTPLISALLASNTVTTGAVASAQVRAVDTACALSLTGTLTVSSTTLVSNCVLASNAASATAINVTATLSGASTLTAVGGCCGALMPPLARPASPYHPATIDPFAAAQTLVLPVFTSATCDAFPAAVNDVNGTPVITLVPADPAAPRAYCSSDLVAGGGDLTIPAGTKVAVPPGTYFFNNVSLIMKASGMITCIVPGVTISCLAGSANGATFVFTGDAGRIGTVTITQGVVTLIGPAANTYSSALNGIVFYGRGIGTATYTTTYTTTVPGANSQRLNGGLYFPNSVLIFGGNRSAASTCLMPVAAALTFLNARLTTGNCSGYGTPVAIVQAARLVN